MATVTASGENCSPQTARLCTAWSCEKLATVRQVRRLPEVLFFTFSFQGENFVAASQKQQLY